MNYQEFQGVETPNFAISVHVPDSSTTLDADTEPDEIRIISEDCYCTWNWQEAADELGIKEPTLRKIWWTAKLEPAFRYCPKPLRVVTRTTPTRQIEEFTAFGMEVLKAYKAEREKGDRAAEVFLAEARVKYPVPTAPACPTPPHPSQKPLSIAIEVDAGNHKIVLPPPALPQTYTLEGLRHVESVEIEDPLALAEQFLEAADLLQDAMQRDIEQREQKLQQTRQAKNAVVAKAQELKLEQRFYRERANQVGSAQTEETQALQDALSTLQGLGKPAAASGTSAA
ncbi:hypothetical protein [Leptolyngbya ohadii]|uniref:hypothetical protein n=1 Tax=Leptolyngbya ohadii TaxID=1962290 RepID=UPI000B59C7B2|nr:hypothetical protein [Leptolyngbya ohadii]